MVGFTFLVQASASALQKRCFHSLLPLRAGHSKWHNIQHKKGRNDKLRAAITTKYAREIRMAIKVGGGNNDPRDNYRLESVIRRALKDSVSKAVIDKALKGSDKDEANLEEGLYEGNSPGGILYMIDTLTDNNKRTFMELRTVFKKAGGKIGGGGSALFTFQRQGLMSVILPASMNNDLDKLFEAALDAGARDVDFDSISIADNGDSKVDVFSDVDNLHQVSSALRDVGYGVENEKLIRTPLTTLHLSQTENQQSYETFEKILEGLSESPDVCEVSTNVEFVK
mmetsp:Transcript_1466/g.1881  ORF Transcript_1466/g.1881 Transcript_1466/m.1881 type:complete len:283 (-) Transcript_1466:1112-1960(-)